MIYLYFVNLDERGEFYADVRNPETDETIYEIKSTEEGIPEIEDGFMRHTHDLAGLTKYLGELGIIGKEDLIAGMGR